MIFEIAPKRKNRSTNGEPRAVGARL
jgi:hypothetical protein